MIKRIINLRSNTITFSAGLIAFSVGMSALLGLLRDRVLIYYANEYLDKFYAQISAIEIVDIYFAAFRVPDFIYGILITGGIVAAFLPVFSSTFAKDKEEGWKLASNTLNLLLILLVLICGLLFLLSPLVVRLVAPGFSVDQLEYMTLLTRIMLLSPILLGASSLFSGVLQYFDRFLAYSLAPILYNIGIIFGIIFLSPYLGMMGLAYGVILGSLFHLFIQIPPAYFSGFSYKPVLDIGQKELRKIFYLVLPRIVGQASVKVNIIVVTALASTLAAGSVSIFNLSNHLQAFPVRAIGVAFAVAAFPAFSKSLALKEKDKFFRKLSSVVRQVLFFIIPASVLFFLLRAHIVRLVYGVEGFGWAETQLTAASLGVFAFSFFAATLIHLLVRVFFSFHDTKTPVIASLIAMGSNIALAFFFVWALGFDNFFRELMVSFLNLQGILNIEVVAFPLAIFFSSVLHLLLLSHFLHRKLGTFKGFGVKECLKRVLFSSFLMGATIYLSRIFMSGILPLDTFFTVFIQTSVAVLLGLTVYLLSSKMLNSPEFFEVKRAFHKR